MNDTRKKVESKLTDNQQRVVELLAEGMRDSEIAVVAGVSLDEIRIWKKSNPLFIAELNYRRKTLWENSVDLLRGLVPLSLSALQGVLNDTSNPQRWRAAMEVVKIVGLSPESTHDLGRVVGSDDPKGIESRIR